MTRDRTRTTEKKPPPPLDEARMRDLALHYAGRYATTRARLIAYLRRKLRERGWAGEESPDPDGLVARFADLGYVDDAGFATTKGAALTRRGFGVRRVGNTLRAAGIEEADREPALEEARADPWASADAFARRKRFGPYATAPLDPAQRNKRIAAFLRAGHDYATARTWIDAAPGEMPDRDD